MEDIFKSIKAFLYDRTVSPLFGAYVSAWSLWNYRVFVALLDGDSSLFEKMEFINSHFKVVTYTITDYPFQVNGQIIHGILWPAILTVGYLYLYPLLAKPVYKHSLEKQKDLREAKQDAEKLRLLSRAESSNLIKEIEQLRLKAEEDEQSYRKRISSLTETINTLELNMNSKSIDELATSSVDTHQKNAQSHDDFYNLISDSVKTIPDGEFQLANIFKANEWQGLDELTRKEYEKLFNKLVERGNFVGVSISRNGPANQVIYKKHTSDSNSKSSTSEYRLRNELEEDIFGKYKIESEKERIFLLNKMAAYCIKNDINKNMLTIVLKLVSAGGRKQSQDLYKELKTSLSNNDVDHLLAQLENKKLITPDSYQGYELTDLGNEMVINSGAASLGKKLISS